MEALISYTVGTFLALLPIVDGTFALIQKSAPGLLR
jgi:hypothetical protein